MHLYTVLQNRVIWVMRELFHFHGRGNHEIASDSIMLIESDEGTVLGITIQCGQVEFMVGFCRKALADRWGLYCHEPFRRGSSPDLRRSWSEPLRDAQFIFRAVRMHLMREEEWMTSSR